MQQQEQRPVCIYHHDCIDGLAAAWVVWKFFKGEVDLVPGDYRDTTPPEIVKGREVYIVDFSYKLPVMEQLVQDAKKIVLIDHHSGAVLELAKMISKAPKNTAIIIEPGIGGAVLTWKYFYGTERIPEGILAVEDRDLWRFKLPYTHGWVAALFSRPFTVEAFDELVSRPVEEVRAEGEGIVRKQKQDIERLLPNARRMKFDGIDVPVINATRSHASDIGSLLCEGEPFAVVYWDLNDCRKFSLRSKFKDGAPGALDVSLIAKRFARGSGHESAAGFYLDYDDPRFAQSLFDLSSEAEDESIKIDTGSVVDLPPVWQGSEPPKGEVVNHIDVNDPFIASGLYHFRRSLGASLVDATANGHYLTLNSQGGEGASFQLKEHADPTQCPKRVFFKLISGDIENFEVSTIDENGKKCTTLAHLQLPGVTKMVSSRPEPFDVQYHSSCDGTLWEIELHPGFNIAELSINFQGKTTIAKFWLSVVNVLPAIPGV